MSVIFKEFPGNIIISPILRTQTEFFSSTVTREFKKGGYDRITNANFYALPSFATRVRVTSKHEPIPPEETIPEGYVVSDNRLIAGQTSQDYYLSFDKNKMKADGAGKLEAFNTGRGDPPTDVFSAFGGLGPLIINGLKYGTTNIYSSELPKDAPPKDVPQVGEPASKYKPYLLQRSSAKFAAFTKKDSTKRIGKLCIGVSASKLYLYIQSHGENSGKERSLSQIRDRLFDLGCKHAVFFDGSDSVLYYDKNGFQISQGEDKDETCVVGIGFKIIPNPT